MEQMERCSDANCAICGLRPVAPPETVQRLKLEADQVVVALEPEQFGGVGRWYQDFAETTDDKVQKLLAER